MTGSVVGWVLVSCVWFGLLLAPVVYDRVRRGRHD